MIKQRKNSLSPGWTLPVAALLYMLVVSLKVTPATGASLQQIWNFSAPALRDPYLDPNGLRINVLYNVSDFISPGMVVYNVSNWDCNVSVEEWFVPSLISPAADFVQGDGTGAGTIEIEINVDPDSFASATGDLASYWQQDSEERYEVKFCLFSGVQTIEQPPTIVDYSLTNIAVTYDLTSGFAVTLSVSPVRDNQNADEAYGPEGFFCDNDGNPLSEEDKAFLAAPGSQLSVCVIPNEKARNAGFGLDKINEFSWVRTDENGGTVEQEAVSDGQSPGDGLTQMVCDDVGCNFVTVLKADFFVASIAADCRRPLDPTSGNPIFCAAPNDRYYEFDCDGDGLLDQFCYNPVTDESSLLSSISYCAQQFGVGSLGPVCPALASFSCPRPSPAWCNATLDYYYEVDCNGDGFLDQYCYNMQSEGEAWLVSSSSKGCVDRNGIGRNAPSCSRVHYAPIMSQLNGWMGQCDYCNASGQKLYNQGPEVLLDGNPNTKWFVNNTYFGYVEFNFEDYVAFHFDEQVNQTFDAFDEQVNGANRTIVAYKLTTGDGEKRSDPKNFALQVMTWEDQSKFVTLDTQSYNFIARKQTVRFPLATPFTGNIKTIRLMINNIWNATEVQEIQLAEFQVFEELVNQTYSWVENLKPMLWKTNGLMEQCEGCNTDNTLAKSLDGDPRTYWYTEDPTPYLEFHFNMSIQNFTRIIYAYKLTSGDWPYYDPSNCVLQVMTRENPTSFITVDEPAQFTFDRMQSKIFFLDSPFIGNITTIRLNLTSTNFENVQLGEFQVFGAYPGQTPFRRLISEPVQGVEEGEGASSRGLRGPQTSGVVAVSSPEDSQEVSRQLQTGTTTIGGYGVATVKFGRRRYRRNLLTGEESWEEFLEHRERRLQVGGSGSIQLELEIQQFPREGLYGKASSASIANLVISLTIVAISSIFFL